MNRPLRIFLDANVLFSASNISANIAGLIDFALQAGHVLVSCDLAVREAQVNIERKRPAWSAGLAALLGKIEHVESVHFPLGVELAEKDVPILCAAVRARCDYFVTGDKRDFGALFDQEVQGGRVVSLLRLAEVLVEGGDPRHRG